MWMIDVISRTKTDVIRRDGRKHRNQSEMEKKRAKAHPPIFIFAPRPTVRRSRASPRFRSGFLIRAIFPGRSHVNFRRPMTRQAREAQTSMIFRVFRVRVESKIPDRLNQSLSHFVCPPRHLTPHPLFLVDIDTRILYLINDTLPYAIYAKKQRGTALIKEVCAINEGYMKQLRKGSL